MKGGPEMVCHWFETAAEDTERHDFMLFAICYARGLSVFKNKDIHFKHLESVYIRTIALW